MRYIFIAFFIENELRRIKFQEALIRHRWEMERREFESLSGGCK